MQFNNKNDVYHAQMLLCTIRGNNFNNVNKERENLVSFGQNMSCELAGFN